MTEEHRTKIANSQILKHLIDAAEGKTEMTSTRATIALGLLKKVMPDLSSTENTHEHSGEMVHEIRRSVVDPRNPNS